MIELEGVGFAYGGAPVLRDVSFSLAAGEHAVLLGANGSGKSTLLRILNALQFPTTGSYRFRGETVTPRLARDRHWGREFRSQVVLLFQDPDAMLFNPTLFDEIAFAPRQLGWPDIGDRVAHWAEQVGLQGRLDDSPLTLSQGQKQRACLAALLILEPTVVLLDEPTGNLDPRSTGWLVDLLRDLDATVVTSTHNLSLAPELGNRALVLGEDHRLLHDGPVGEVVTDRDTLWAANLLHSHRHHHHGAVAHEHFHSHDWD